MASRRLLTLYATNGHACDHPIIVIRMPLDITGYLVFIASPGGLQNEREAFRKTIVEANEDALYRGAIFIPVGWEDTFAGVGRPQEIINRDLRECDYFVLLLADRWGTPTGSGNDYSSGTE